jgi:hypothetical protein
LAALCQRIFRERSEELQCDSRKATFTAANKAGAVGAERNLLVLEENFLWRFFRHAASNINRLTRSQIFPLKG